MKETVKGKQRKGSVLDLLLILLLLLSLVGILWRRHSLQSAQDMRDSVPYRFLTRAESVITQTADCISVGDRLYTAAGEYYGEIVRIERVPARVELLSGGVYYEGEWEEALRCDLTLEIEVSGLPTDRGILVGDGRVAVGSTLPPLYSDRAVFNLFLYKMSLKEAY